MRIVTAIFLATTLLVSAAEAEVAVPLPAGKSAGVKEAALLGPSIFLVLISAGIIIGGITLAVSNNGGNGITSPVATSTSTSTASLP